MLRLVFQGVVIIVIAAASVGGVVMYREVGLTRALVVLPVFQAVVGGLQVNHERRPHGTQAP